MNAGGNRSGTRFTPRMADAATQTYLYGSSDPIPSKANHRMGAAGGGLRDSHLLRGGAREGSYQRVAGIYERTGDDTVTVEFKVSILRGPMTREEVRFDYRYERECLVREKIIKIEVALLYKVLFLWFHQRRIGKRSTGRILRPAASRMRGRVQTADGAEDSSAESYSDDGHGGHSDDSRPSMELNATYSLRLDPDMDDDDRAQYIAELDAARALDSDEYAEFCDGKGMLYDRDSDDGLVSNVRIESDDQGDDQDLYDQGDEDHGDDQGNSAHGYSDEDPGADQVPYDG